VKNYRSQVIRHHPEDEDKHGVMQFSSVKFEPGLRPYGFALRHLEGKYVTHRVFYLVDIGKVTEDGREYEAIILTVDAFEHGHYFDYGHGVEPQDALARARADYDERTRGRS
jgi:hypothetical protein